MTTPIDNVAVLYQHADGRYGLALGSATFAERDPSWWPVKLAVIEAPPPEPIPQTHVVPSPGAILESISTSRWLKEALRAALARDPVDAANDADVLFQVLDAHAAAVLEGEVFRRDEHPSR